VSCLRPVLNLSENNCFLRTTWNCPPMLIGDPAHLTPTNGRSPLLVMPIKPGSANHSARPRHYSPNSDKRTVRRSPQYRCAEALLGGSKTRERVF
jgi:hypothetical protein